jgi:hypothetical protein
VRLQPEVIPDARRRRRAGGRFVRWLRFAGAPLLLSAQIVAAAAGDVKGNAPSGSYRAAQDKGLDLTADYDAPFANQPGDIGGAPPGSFRAAQDLPARVDWSRRVGKSWELDPVLLHRRQAGRPDRPDDDLSKKTLGIELRRRF